MLFEFKLEETSCTYQSVLAWNGAYVEFKIEHLSNKKVVSFALPHLLYGASFSKEEFYPTTGSDFTTTEITHSETYTPTTHDNGGDIPASTFIIIFAAIFIIVVAITLALWYRARRSKEEYESLI